MWLPAIGLRVNIRRAGGYRKNRTDIRFAASAAENSVGFQEILSLPDHEI